MALFDDNELIKRMQYLEERKKERSFWNRIVNLENEDKTIRNEIVN